MFYLFSNSYSYVFCVTVAGFSRNDTKFVVFSSQQHSFTSSSHNSCLAKITRENVGISTRTGCAYLFPDLAREKVFLPDRVATCCDPYTQYQQRLLFLIHTNTRRLILNRIYKAQTIGINREDRMRLIKRDANKKIIHLFSLCNI